MSPLDLKVKGISFSESYAKSVKGVQTESQEVIAEKVINFSEDSQGNTTISIPDNEHLQAAQHLIDMADEQAHEAMDTETTLPSEVQQSELTSQDTISLTHQRFVLPLAVERVLKQRAAAAATHDPTCPTIVPPVTLFAEMSQHAFTSAPSQQPSFPPPPQQPSFATGTPPVSNITGPAHIPGFFSIPSGNIISSAASLSGISQVTMSPQPHYNISTSQQGIVPSTAPTQQEQQDVVKPKRKDRTQSQGVVKQLRVSGCYYCEKCPRHYGTEWDLKQHILYHCGKVGEKRFECKRCGTKYSLDVGVKEHIAVVHVKKQPYQCVFCGEKFWRGSWFTDHKNNEHPNDTHPKHVWAEEFLNI